MHDQTLPMNSVRLKGTYVQRIARSLDLPTGRSNAKTRQLIKGKLIAMDREPQNVQVLLEPPDTEAGEEKISLMDIYGVFLEVSGTDLEEEPGMQTDEEDLLTDPGIRLTGLEGEQDQSDAILELKSKLEEAVLSIQELEASRDDECTDEERERVC